METRNHNKRGTYRKAKIVGYYYFKNMKKNLTAFLILLLVFMSSNFLHGQTAQVAFELINMNVLYAGIDNPVKIVSDNKIDSVSVFAGYSLLYLYDDFGNIKDSIWSENYCKITKKENNYIVNVGPYSSCELEVYSNGKMIESRKFRIKRVPLPTIKFGTKEDGETITKYELAAASSLYCSIEDFAFDVKFEVVSYEIDKVSKGKTTIREVLGSNLNSEMKSWIMESKPNDKLIFNSIKIKGPDGVLRSMGDLVLIVK